MARVFISYSRQDRDFTERLYHDLQAAGAAVWLDLEGISPSAPWEHEVQDAIESSEAFIFVMSPNSIRSQWCQSELSFALEVGKLIIPVVARSVPPEDAPTELQKYQWISFTDPDHFDVALRHLLESLGPTRSYVGPISTAEEADVPSGCSPLVSGLGRWLIVLVLLGLSVIAYFLRPNSKGLAAPINPLILLVAVSLVANVVFVTLLLKRGQPRPATQSQSTSGVVFISYSRSDSDFVDKLDDDLRKAHFKTWVDRRKLEGGQIWDAKIVDALNRCQLVLVILSPDALRSDWVRKEYRYAMKQGKTLVPIVYHPCPKIPKILAKYQHMDFQAGLNFEAKYRFRFSELVAALDAIPLPRLEAAA